ncbi:hypothetical protein Leryth_014655 [Lithospermum erythrorhizon]|nr:hypothetical protein Leryth_014655 [Lithospermum erythrorhizon]
MEKIVDLDKDDNFEYTRRGVALTKTFGENTTTYTIFEVTKTKWLVQRKNFKFIQKGITLALNFLKNLLLHYIVDNTDQTN